MTIGSIRGSWPLRSTMEIKMAFFAMNLIQGHAPPCFLWNRTKHLH